MLRRFRPDLVVDVGANRGQFALAAQMSGVREIISFEPVPSEAAIYRRNCANARSVVLHEVALSDAAGEVILHVTDRPDSSSLLRPGPGQEKAFGIRSSQTIRVETRRLDDVIDQAMLRGKSSMLKIDVQGAERSVLLGATGLLSEFTYVYAECSYVELYERQALANDLIGFLADHGFSVRGVYNTTETTAFGPTQSDFLFGRAAP